MERRRVPFEAATARRLAGTLLVGALAAASLVAPCPASAAAELSAEQIQDLEALTLGAASTGGEVDLRLNGRNAAPRFLGLRRPATARGGAPAGDQEVPRRTAARSFLSDYRRLLRIVDPDTELALEREETDELGLTHLRFAQRHGGLSVWGGEVLVHVDALGEIYLVQGYHNPVTQAPDATPALSGDDAVRAAREHLGSGSASEGGTPAAELLLYPTDDALRLAYRVQLAPRPGQSWTYFVDAATAQILGRLNNLRTDGLVGGVTAPDVQGNPQTINVWESLGAYYLVDPTTPFDEGAGLYDPLGPAAFGDLRIVDMANSDDTGGAALVTAAAPEGPWDPSGVSAMANLVASHEYFRQTFGLLGFDGLAGSIRAGIHFREEAAVSYDNAHWDRSQGWFMFGDGGAVFRTTAGCFDLVAHEYTHAVTDYRVGPATTMGFVYRNQSGALSESYSDFFAAMVDRDDWTVSEGCMSGTAPFLRDLAHPHSSLGWQPATMSEYLDWPEDQDNGGVHFNSGIPNRAGYLLAEGLTTEGRGAGVGREKAEQIWYRALHYLSPTSEFSDAALATARAASDLYGEGSPERAAATASWDAVEVFPPERFTGLGTMWGGEGGEGLDLGPGVDLGPCFLTTAAPAGRGEFLLLVVGAGALGCRARRKKR